MLWYIGRRLLQMIPVFLGATLIVYLLAFAASGDPILTLAGDKPISPAVEQQLREQYNLDKPVLVQWLIFLGNVLTFDLGVGFNGRPLIDQIAAAFPTTIKLALIAVAVETVFGIVAGVISGLRKGTWIDTTLLLLSLTLIAVPTFVIGFVAQFVLGVQLGIAEINVGRDPSFRNLLLPGIVLGAVSFAYVLRLTRTSIAETATADHVRTATAKGLSRGGVIGKHILRNSLIPVVTFIGADLGALMGGAIVTERIFNIPGVGTLLFRSINDGEAPMIVALVTLLVIIFLLSNLVVDLLYAVLDPRIRYAK
ncbi:ABC transporter permease [Brachybacterium aquaticum]|uniref:Oligopeptide transport system permease protein n=1 Tax=Brachybacterium aquaticum TaxID=1432564 RepID=A0A841AF72_9MICO|nr:ABC transporter permease [Brachybacterium aquaticum]MBB5831975.1 oligopeptide transport system permease protein [Brachybacterium aquaticum]